MAILHVNGVSDNAAMAMLLLILPFFCFMAFTVYKCALARMAKTATDGAELRVRALSIETRIDKSIENLKKADRQAAQMRVQVVQLKKTATRKGIASSVKEADRILLTITDFKKSTRERMERMEEYRQEINTILSQIDRLVVSQQQIRRLEQIMEKIAKQQREYTRQLEQLSNLFLNFQRRQEQIHV